MLTLNPSDTKTLSQDLAAQNLAGLRKATACYADRVTPERTLEGDTLASGFSSRSRCVWPTPASTIGSTSGGRCGSHGPTVSLTAIDRSAELAAHFTRDPRPVSAGMPDLRGILGAPIKPARQTSGSAQILSTGSAAPRLFLTKTRAMPWPHPPMPFPRRRHP